MTSPVLKSATSGRALAAIISLASFASFVKSGYDLSYGLTDIPLGIATITLYYTHLITLLTGVVFAAAFLFWERFSNAHYVGHIVISLSILVVHYWIFAGWANFVESPTRSKIVHGLLPVLVMVFWIVYADKRALSWRSPLAWTAFAIAYTTYALVRGAITGEYAYDVGNVERLGYAKVLSLIGLTTLVTIVAGYALLFATRTAGRLQQVALPEIAGAGQS